MEDGAKPGPLAGVPDMRSGRQAVASERFGVHGRRIPDGIGPATVKCQMDRVLPERSGGHRTGCYVLAWTAVTLCIDGRRFFGGF